jgi:hypothetical protein
VRATERLHLWFALRNGGPVLAQNRAVAAR